MRRIIGPFFEIAIIQHVRVQAHFGKDGKLDPVIPHVNQEILAARVGTTRSRINYFMNKFRKLGFIEYDNGTLNVLSLLKTSFCMACERIAAKLRP